MRRRGAFGVISVVVAAMALVTAGGNGLFGGATERADARPVDRPIVVTRNERNFRPSCGPRAVGRRLQGFSRALATVNTKALRRYWGRGFRWFGFAGPGIPRTGARLNSYERGIAKLRRWHGIRLRFDEVLATGDGGAVEGIARDSSPGYMAGKVALYCRKPSIKQGFVTFGPDAVGIDVVDCPEPSRPVPRNAMIVYTR